MKSLISNLMMALLFGGVFAVSAAQAKKIEYSHYVFRLTSVEIDARSSVRRKIHCDSGDIVGDIVGTSKSKGLRPSYRPYDEQAAWHINKGACPDLEPEYNGVGFDSFNENTGRAIIYITHFQRKPLDYARISTMNRRSKEYLRMIQRPEVSVSNTKRMKAQCNFSGGGFSVVVDPKLVCTLEDGNGRIVLRAIKLHPGNYPANQ